MKHGNSKGRAYKVIDIPGTPEIVVPNGWWLAQETIYASVAADIAPGTSNTAASLAEHCVVKSTDPEPVRRNIRSVSLRQELKLREGEPFTATNFIWYAKDPFVVAVISNMHSSGSRHRATMTGSSLYRTETRFIWPRQIRKGELTERGVPVPELEKHEEAARRHRHHFVPLSALAEIMRMDPVAVIDRFGFLVDATEGFGDLFMHAESQVALSNGRRQQFTRGLMLGKAMFKHGDGPESTVRQTIDKVWVPLELAHHLIVLDRLGMKRGEADLFPTITYS